MVGSTCQRLPNSARPAGVWLNAAPAAGYPGHHRRLPRAHGVDLGAGLAPAAGLVHHQVWRERQAGVALLLEHDRRRGAVRGEGRHAGVEVSQGGVVGPRLGEREADEPTDAQVGGEQFFQGGVGAGIGPGADEFHAHELGDAEGGRGTRGAGGVMVALTGSDDGSRVIPLVEQHERMLGAAPQQRAVDQGFEPDEDGGEERADEELKLRRHVWQVARAGAQHGWYNGHP